MLSLALKLFLAPALVVASTLAGRHWGPRVGGVLVTLPIVAGPILLIIYLDQGAAFTALAATATTLAIAPLALFMLTFAYVSRRHGWLVTLGISWLIVGVVDFGLAWVRVPAFAALVVAVLALHGATLLIRRMETPAPDRVTPPAWDLPARAVATAALVLAVTGLAATLGPTATGVLAPFPIALSVVLAFTLAQNGHPGVLAVTRGILPGLDGFALFCFLVAVTLEPLGAPAAFGLATAGALIVAFVLTVLSRGPGRVDE